jgi:hypothetical protein
MQRLQANARIRFAPCVFSSNAAQEFAYAAASWMRSQLESPTVRTRAITIGAKGDAEFQPIRAEDR